ncbi:hypothetical protein H0H93_010674 [Arthromyces matolae]|nr:hypothetical protein H0H93_010674 [Arthromyces matolae]
MGFKQWKTTNDQQKRRSLAHTPFSTRAHGRKPLRNLGNTPRRSVTPLRFDPDDPTLYDSDVAQSDNDDEQDSDNDAKLFVWDEERTLLSDLLDASANESEDPEYDDLINKLQPAFDEQGRELKKEIAETLVPTVNRVKGLFGQIESKVDVSFGKGIIMFNNACKDAELLAMKDEDELKDAKAHSQRTIQGLLVQLKEAYANRSRLWTDFEKAIQETGSRFRLLHMRVDMIFYTQVGPTMEALRDLPGNVENVITKLEKQSRKLEKDDANATSAAEKKIKDILGKT